MAEKDRQVKTGHVGKTSYTDRMAELIEWKLLHFQKLSKDSI